MATRRHARWILLGGLAFATACSSPTSTSQYVQPNQSPLQTKVTTDPPPDANGNIARDAIIHILFLGGEYPDPDSISFGPVLLRSGTASFDVDMKVDLVGQQVIVRPRSLLAPDTQYEVVVGADVRALSGRTVQSTMAYTLQVGELLNPSPTPSPSPVTWYGTAALNGTDGAAARIGDFCAPYCHTIYRCPGRMPTMRNPTMGLDLSTPFDPMIGLINVPSQLTAGSDHPMMRVVPGDASRSMVMRKLLGGDPNTGINPDPGPAMCMDPPEPEPANLGVPGRRMPLYEAPCDDCRLNTLNSDGSVGPPVPPSQWYLSDDDLRLVQAWIDDGAQMGTPPPP
jgi:hypothetical protein